jgi:hypothetical protein
MTRWALATIAVVATVGAAFAGDRQNAQSESIIRPPASIPAPRGQAAAAPKTNSAERHAAEFLRWKDQRANPSR